LKRAAQAKLGVYLLAISLAAALLAEFLKVPPYDPAAGFGYS
jgi:hypothetical protein